MSAAAGFLIAGRNCDGCDLCCTVNSVAELGKPQNMACVHCVAGKGCGIYETRPGACRSFYCVYRTSEALGEEWKPSRANFVVAADPGGSRISIFVDPKFPEAWRDEPYLSAFHAWSQAGLRMSGQVVVFVSHHAFVILPDRIADLGVLEPDDLIITEFVWTPTGFRMEPFKAGPDDPRAKRFLAGLGPA